jgi:hypothetical protein
MNLTATLCQTPAENICLLLLLVDYNCLICLVVMVTIGDHFWLGASS